MWEWVKDLTSDSPQRDPGYLIALVEWLPSAGAFAACLQDATAGQGGEAKGPHRFYERGVLWNLLADHWDLHAAVNAGRKKKPPMYPRPGSKQKSRGMSLFSMRPKKQ